MDVIFCVLLRDRSKYLIKRNKEMLSQTLKENVKEPTVE